MGSVILKNDAPMFDAKKKMEAATSSNRRTMDKRKFVPVAKGYVEDKIQNQ